MPKAWPRIFSSCRPILLRPVRIYRRVGLYWTAKRRSTLVCALQDLMPHPGPEVRPPAVFGRALLWARSCTRMDSIRSRDEDAMAVEKHAMLAWHQYLCSAARIAPPNGRVNCFLIASHRLDKLCLHRETIRSENGEIRLKLSSIIHLNHRRCCGHHPQATCSYMVHQASSQVVDSILEHQHQR